LKFDKTVGSQPKRHRPGEALGGGRGQLLVLGGTRHPDEQIGQLVQKSGLQHQRVYALCAIFVVLEKGETPTKRLLGSPAFLREQLSIL
jgi:hypothetical protein